MRVKFTSAVQTKEAVPQTFAAGEEVDFYEVYRNDPELKRLHGDDLDAVAMNMAKASAAHWVNRGKAVEIKEPVKAGAKLPGRTAPPPPPEEKAEAPGKPEAKAETHKPAGK